MRGSRPGDADRILRKSMEVGMTVRELAPAVQDRPWLKVYRELGVAPSAPEIEERSLADYVEDNVRNAPGKVALVYTDKGVEIAWAQLDAYANRFANLLRSLDMHKGDVLGIHLPNTPQYVVALVGGEIEQEILAFCRATMAPYKVPRSVHFHDALPLTAVGKLDKKALRPAIGSTSAPGRTRRPP